jgi:predicted AAA+ superfamily ATPase
MLIPRDARATLERLARGFPILWLTGPRQSGKTTLARVARPDMPYINLERPDEREFVRSDPRGFLAAHPEGAIIDEVQHAPELMSWLQAHVDERPQMGAWLLTGSQQPAIAQSVTQSLAGRVGLLQLLPLAGGELDRAGLLPSSLDEVLFTGGYPAVFDRDVPVTAWLGSYAATYVERDVRLLTAVRDLDTFTRFVRLCAARSAQLLNMASLGADVGISVPTVKAWISLLRATYIIDLVEPYHLNVTTRLVKSPKLVFTDVGLMSYFLGIGEAAQIAAHPLRGALFETWCLTEQLKAWRNAGDTRTLTFLRDRQGAEMDLVYQVGHELQAVEFKSGATIAADWWRPMRQWRDRSAHEAWRKPRVVYGGDAPSLRTDVDFLDWRTYAREVSVG